MAGSQTNGFDMVIEVSTSTINNIVSGIFDNEGFLGSLLPDSYFLEGFDVNLGFNRPSDVPASAANPVEILVDLELSGGNTGQLRVVAGVVVDRSDDETDLVHIDFRDHLYVCEISINGISLGPVNTFVTNKIKEHTIPLIPIPVKRSSTNSLDIISADVKIIDDTTAADQDALGVMLTFGGGAAGNLNAFNRAFAREGAGAAVAINFDWLCRNISPSIEEAIGLSSGDFSNCSFRGSHTIKDGVNLTELDITPGDDNIRVSGKVKKSGFCYEATGEIGARIFVSVEAGELRVRFETDDPDIDVDIPLYCYLAAGVIGAVLGAVIIGVIGSIVGAILIPLILWIAQSVVESTVENIADQVTDAVGGAGLTVPLVGIDTVLDRAFIDDLTITYNMFPGEYAEVKSEGSLLLRNGQFLDLDNGIVKSNSFSGAELQLQGSGDGRRLKALCGTSLGTGYIPSFQRARRFHLYGLTYGETNEIPLEDVALHMPIPWFDDGYICNYRVFGAKTTDGCLTLFQVSDVDESRYRIRYRTYQLESASVRIVGGFKCKPDRVNFEVERVDYIPSHEVNHSFEGKLQTEFEPNQGEMLRDIENIRRMDSHMGEKGATPYKTEYVEVEKGVNFSVADNIEFDRKVLDFHRPVGNWIETRFPERKDKYGYFRASLDGNAVASSVSWTVDGNGLEPESEGTVNIQGETFEYKTHGHFLKLTSNSGKEMEIPLKVIVVTERGSVLTEIRCVPFLNNCGYTSRRIPGFLEYIERFRDEFGVIKTPSKNPQLVVSHCK
ncbi:MAG: hypothetical protein R6U46_04345 [Marinilabilia sp.]